MPRNHVVRLRKGIEAEFPQRCVVCMDRAAITVKVGHNTAVSLYRRRFVFAEIFADGFVSIPLCRKCKWRFIVQRAIGGWSWIGLVAAIFLVSGSWGFIANSSADGYGWFVTGMVFAALLPSLIFELGCARYFWSTTARDVIDYSFANSRYAKMFRKMNQERKDAGTQGRRDAGTQGAIKLRRIGIAADVPRALPSNVA